MDGVFVADYQIERAGIIYNYRMFRVEAETFHFYFSRARPYVRNSECVDLHHSYEGCKCFLSEDGMQGFAIEGDGNLVSVFRAGDKFAFVDAVRELIIVIPKQNMTLCNLLG